MRAYSCKVCFTVVMHTLQCITPCNALKHLISSRKVIIFGNFEESSLMAKKIDNTKWFFQDHSSVDFFQDHCILSIPLTCEFFQDHLVSFKTIYQLTSFKTTGFFQDHWFLSKPFIRWNVSRPLVSFKTIYQYNCFKTIYKFTSFNIIGSFKIIHQLASWLLHFTLMTFLSQLMNGLESTNGLERSKLINGLETTLLMNGLKIT